jgi:hypothetical protein
MKQKRHLHARYIVLSIPIAPQGMNKSTTFSKNESVKRENYLSLYYIGVGIQALTLIFIILFLGSADWLRAQMCQK